MMFCVNSCFSVDSSVAYVLFIDLDSFFFFFDLFNYHSQNVVPCEDFINPVLC